MYRDKEFATGNKQERNTLGGFNFLPGFPFFSGKRPMDNGQLFIQRETPNISLFSPPYKAGKSYMEKKKEIVMSGIRPTGFLHLGNYFGALRNYVKMQEEYECYFMVADLHSLTTHPDTKELKANVHRVLAENIACGLDPDKAALYCQSHIHETAELYLYLNMLAYKGELEKTVTFKDKSRQQPDNINAGLLTYPVLQTADILLHRASLVPVGKDQEQHLEMARNFANRFNHRYGNIFPEPVAFNYGSELVKVPSLDGGGKMSKSENQNATLYLADEDDVIRKKVMKAKTDAGPAEPFAQKPDYIKNLFLLMKLVSTHEVIKKFDDDYNSCVIRYGDMKKQLAEDMVNFIAPIREKVNAILNDEKFLRQVMEKGAAKAGSSAKATMELVREAVGLNY
jgi:tryptophanyl-tRNA synthetase